MQNENQDLVWKKILSKNIKICAMANEKQYTQEELEEAKSLINSDYLVESIINTFYSPWIMEARRKNNIPPKIQFTKIPDKEYTLREIELEQNLWRWQLAKPKTNENCT